MKKSTRGFTLIELMVVIGIIAILAAVGIASYVQAGRSARNSRRVSDVESVRQALVMFRSENGAYPTTAAGGNFGNVGNLNNTAAAHRGHFNTVVELLATDGFISRPTPADNTYRYGGTEAAFCICTSLEGNTGGNSTAWNCNSFTQDRNLGTHYCARQP